MKYRKLIKAILFSYWVIIFHPIKAQMPEMDYDALYDSIRNSAGTAVQEIYMKEFLRKAKREKNQEEVLNGYRNYMHYTQGDLSMTYGDSMVWAAFKSQDSLLIGDALLSRGIQFYSLKNYPKAMKYYLEANQYAQEEYQKNKITYSIAQVNYYLEQYTEAIKLFEKAAIFFEEDSPNAYLNTLHGLASSYSKLGEIQKSNFIIEKGKLVGKKMGIDRMDIYFNQLLGINQFHQNQLSDAIQTLEENLDDWKGKSDFANETVSLFYLGKAFWMLNDKEKAVSFFHKVEVVFLSHGYIRPDLREAFDYLAEYYLYKGDHARQIHYLNLKQKASVGTEANYLNLFSQLLKGYKSPEIEVKDNSYGWKILWISLVSLIVLSLLLPLFLRKKSHANHVEISDQATGDLISEEPLPEYLSSLLEKLEVFEKEKRFLKQNWTQAELASYLGTNVRYLNEAIRKYRKTNFSSYINGLRVDYILELLKTNPKLRHYSNMGLAQEAGFSSAPRFSRAFKAKTGKSPREFFKDV